MSELETELLDILYQIRIASGYGLKKPRDGLVEYLKAEHENAEKFRAGLPFRNCRL